MPLHIIDTAGLRRSEDKVEQIGIQRAWDEIRNADQILVVVDSTTTDILDPISDWPDLIQQLTGNVGITIVRNKIDITGEAADHQLVDSEQGVLPLFRIAANTGDGLSALTEHLKQCMGFSSQTDGQFIARRRHLDALESASTHIYSGEQQLREYAAGEILAEELRIAQ
jgi:tRNA modification GTPase